MTDLSKYECHQAKATAFQVCLGRDTLTATMYLATEYWSAGFGGCKLTDTKVLCAFIKGVFNTLQIKSLHDIEGKPFLAYSGIQQTVMAISSLQKQRSFDLTILNDIWTKDDPIVRYTRMPKVAQSAIKIQLTDVDICLVKDDSFTEPHLRLTGKTDHTHLAYQRTVPLRANVLERLLALVATEQLGALVGKYVMINTIGSKTYLGPTGGSNNFMLLTKECA